jgi:hypothetical protein
MDRAIRITAGSVSAEARLNESKTAGAIWDALPIEAKGQTWGDEIYFDIGLTAGPESPREVVELGALAYWPPGRAFAFSAVQHPEPRREVSRGGAAVNVVGKAWGDPSVFGPCVQECDDRATMMPRDGGCVKIFRHGEPREIREGAGPGRQRDPNPSLIAKEKRPFRPLVEEICSIVPAT